MTLVRVHKKICCPDKDEAKKMMLGYVFVLDPRFEKRALWKPPGGHRIIGENPLQTAMRELQEETGLLPPKESFEYCGKWLGRFNDHWKYLFAADIDESELRWMNDRTIGNEGERSKFFTTEDFYALVRAGKFMREHYKKMVEFSAILPFGRA